MQLKTAMNLSNDLCWDFETRGSWIKNRFNPHFLLRNGILLFALLFCYLMIFKREVAEEYGVYLIAYIVIVFFASAFLDNRSSVICTITLFRGEIKIDFNGYNCNHILYKTDSIIFIYRGYAGQAQFPRASGAIGIENELRIVYQNKVYYYYLNIANPRDADRIFKILKDWRDQGVRIVIKREFMPGIHTKGFYFLDDLIFYGKRFYRKYKDRTKQKLEN